MADLYLVAFIMMQALLAATVAVQLSIKTRQPERARRARLGYGRILLTFLLGEVVIGIVAMIHPLSEAMHDRDGQSVPPPRLSFVLPV